MPNYALKKNIFEKKKKNDKNFPQQYAQNELISKNY